MPSSKFSLYCDKIIEMGWLAAIIGAPLFFNVYSSRVFEPDKLTLVRSIAVVMVMAWLVKGLEGAAQSARPRAEITWRSPLVLPTFILVIVYLISTLFSVAPSTSLWGSYQRLQGTYTTFSYIIIFLMILQGLRHRRQLDRLVLTIILTSLPIAFYGLVQRFKLDPLPWGGDVVSRVASNMGNAIFVAAYLIMAFFLTLGRIVESFKAILTEEEAYLADILRAAAYVFIAALQAITIVYTSSRGPWIGWFAGAFVFGLVLLVDLRRQAADQSRMNPKDVGVAIASGAIPVLALVGLLIATQSLEQLQLVVMLVALVAVVAFALWLLSRRQTWKWLWLSWIAIAMVGLGALVEFNRPNTPLAPLRSNPIFGRLGKLFETETGTGKVRTLIWEGAAQLVWWHDPIQYPGGKPDAFNIIRPLIGYGPESMYVAYNRFYQPELAHYELRNASPDRSHNETFDALVITGILGFLAEQLVFISLFIYGFQRLGMMPGRRERNLFIGLWVGLGAVGAVALAAWGGPKMIGVGVPAGIGAGLVAYLGIYSMFLYNPSQDTAPRSAHQLLLISLLAGVVAHYLEIHFGIAIASTRTMFWTFAGMIVVAGAGLVRAAEGRAASPTDHAPAAAPQHKKRRKSTFTSNGQPAAGGRPLLPAWVGSIVSYALTTSVILSTLFYEFTTNPERLNDPLSILWRAMTSRLVNQPPPPHYVTSYAILAMIGLTWVIGGVIILAELSRTRVLRVAGDLSAAAIIYYAVSAGLTILFGLGLATLLSGLTQTQAQTVDQVVEIAGQIAGVLTYYYGFVFLVVFVAAGILLAETHYAGVPLLRGAGVAAFPILMAIALLGIVPATNLNAIRADIIYKQGDPYDKQGQWDVSIAHYKRAISLAPTEDFYYLFLGRAYLEKARATTSTAPNILNEQTRADTVLKMNVQQTAQLSRQDLLMSARAVLVRAREINPLNTDHSANLGRLYRTWADLATTPEQKQQLADKAIEYYRDATTLSPNNAVLWNEWATVYIYLQKDLEAAQQKLDRSLTLDQKFDQTYLILGDMYTSQKQLDKAAEAYEKALSIKPSTQARSVLCYIYAQQGRLDEAITCTQKLVEATPRDWNAHKNLAVLYAQKGDHAQALASIKTARSLAPQDQQATLDAYITQLEAQLARPPQAVITPTQPVTP